MTICYHVDDCKLSNHRRKLNDPMIKWLRQEYESIYEDGSGKITISRGMIHEYLGMTLDYTVRGKFQITMIDFLDEVLIDFEKSGTQGGQHKDKCSTRESI